MLTSPKNNQQPWFFMCITCWFELVIILIIKYCKCRSYGGASHHPHIKNYCCFTFVLVVTFLFSALLFGLFLLFRFRLSVVKIILLLFDSVVVFSIRFWNMHYTFKSLIKVSIVGTKVDMPKFFHIERKQHGIFSPKSRRKSS